jgi:hypothetical protein
MTRAQSGRLGPPLIWSCAAFIMSGRAATSSVAEILDIDGPVEYARQWLKNIEVWIHMNPLFFKGHKCRYSIRRCSESHELKIRHRHFVSNLRRANLLRSESCASTGKRVVDLLTVSNIGGA